MLYHDFWRSDLDLEGWPTFKKIVLDYDFWIREVTYCCYLHMVAAGELCCLSDNSGLIERWYLMCMILVASPFNWHHAVTLTFDLSQGQICCRDGDHNSPIFLVTFALVTNDCYFLYLTTVDLLWRNINVRTRLEKFQIHWNELFHCLKSQNILTTVCNYR